MHASVVRPLLRPPPQFHIRSSAAACERPEMELGAAARGSKTTREGMMQQGTRRPLFVGRPAARKPRI